MVGTAEIYVGRKIRVADDIFISEYSVVQWHGRGARYIIWYEGTLAIPISIPKVAQVTAKRVANIVSR